MQKIDRAHAITSLKASGLGILPGVSGRFDLGQTEKARFDEVKAFYTVKIISTSASDSVDIDFTNGEVTSTQGAPDVIFTGLDFEGLEIEPSTKINALLISGVITQSSAIAISSSLGFASGIDIVNDDFIFQATIRSGETIDTTPFQIDFSASNQQIILTICTS